VVVHAEHVMMLAEQRNLLFSSDQVYLIPWGMEVKAGDKDGERKLARDKLGIPRDSRVALFFGFLRPGKGLDYLIDAVSQLERGCLHVVVAGELDPSLGFDPADIASERGCLSDFDFYTYYIPKERMDLLFNAADFVVLPYSKTLHGDSGVLAHACEYGLPVVASNVGELGKRVKDHNLGLLCEPDSVESLTSVLKRFLSLSRAELSQMRENVLSYASSRSWKWVAQKHAEIYHLAASSRGSCSTLS
jgi:glycosyltransferase involved in cell wall biosynthesis